MKTRFKSASVEPILLPSARKAHQSFGNKRNSKRAKFADTGSDSLVNCDASTRHQTTDAPKTSEYAYFRNIKNQTVPANLCSEHIELSKSSKTNHHLTSGNLTRNEKEKETVNTSGISESATEDRGLFPVSEERAGPSNHHTLLSPGMNLTCKNKQRSLLSENVTPIGRHLSLSPLQHAPEISGNECSKEGIFAAHRQKLHRWVVRTSYSKVQDSVPKGSDLVASLLSRLFPKNEDSLAVHSNNSRCLPFDEPKYLVKGPQLPHGRNVDENLPRICSKNSTSLPFDEPKYVENGSQLLHGRNLDEDLHGICSNNRRSLPLNEPIYMEMEPQLPRSTNLDGNLHGICSNSRSLPLNGPTYMEMGPQLPHSTNLDGSLHGICSNNRRSLPLNEPIYMDMGPQLPRGRKLDENLPGNYFGLSTDIIHSEQDTFVSGYTSTECGSEYAYENDDIMNPILYLNSRQSRGSHRQLNFSFHMPIERYGSSRNCLREPEEFYSPVGYAREEPHKLLLEWDPESQRSEVHSSIFNRDISENLNPCLAIPWHDNYHRTVDNMIDVKASCSSLLTSNHYGEFDSIPNYKSSSCLIEDIEPNFEHPEYKVEEPDQFSPILPYTSTCLSLEEQTNVDDTIDTVNDMFPCRDQYWPKNESWDIKSRHNSWQRSLYATEISEDPSSILCTWQFPQTETRLSASPWLQEVHADSMSLIANHAVDSNLFPPNYQESFRASFDNMIEDHPLLVTNFSSHQCGKDLYFDDDNRLEYSQLL